MVSIDSWQPDLALRAMAEHQVRWTMLVPTMALQLAVRPEAEGRLVGLTAMTVGGGPMNADALGRAERTLGTTIIRVFGMSECLGHTTTRPDEEASTRLGADGRPFPGTEVRAVDHAGRAVEVGGVGAAQVRGPSLFVGYARDGRPVPRAHRGRVPADRGPGPGRTPTARSRSSAARSRSSSAEAATSTSTRWRRPWRASPPCRRCASFPCRTSCSEKGPRRSSCRRTRTSPWRASRASWTRAGSRRPSGRSSSSSSRTCPRTGWESSRVATRPTSRSAWCGPKVT